MHILGFSLSLLFKQNFHRNSFFFCVLEVVCVIFYLFHLLPLQSRKSAKFTLEEVLKHQIDDLTLQIDENATTTTCLPATTESATSDSTARDSGVQIEVNNCGGV